MNPHEEQNKRVIQSMLSALERQDFAALEKHPGLYETRRYHPLWQSAFAGLTYIVQDMISDGDLVATRVIMAGVHTGRFMGVEPTGENFQVGVLMMDRVVDGLIVEHWANADWVSVFGRLGLIPPLPEP